MNFEGVDLGGGTDSEVRAHVGGGGEASSGEDVGPLAHAVGGEVEGGSGCVARAFYSADEMEGDPVIVVGVDVLEEGRDGVHVVDDGVHAAVVEEVADGETTRGHDLGERGGFDGGNGIEVVAVGVVEEERTLGPAGSPVVGVGVAVDVPVDLEKILPAVVVVVDEGGSPAEEGDGDVGDVGVGADVGEVGIAVVAVEDLVVVGESGVEDVELPVVAVVSDGDSHGGGLATIFVEGVAGGVALILKGAVAFVDVEVVWGRVVADEEVGLAVVVDVDEDGGEAVVAGLVADTGLVADVGEGAIAVVVEEVIALAGQAAGATVGANAAIAAEGQGKAVAVAGLRLEVVVDVAGDEEIELAVAVVVSPRGSGGPVAEGDAGLLCDVGKGAIVVVVEEAIFAEVGDVEVGPAVVVVVTDGNAEAPAVVGDSGLGGDVGEGSIVIIVEEGGVWRHSFVVHGRNGAAVDEVDVHPAIVVVVEQSDAGADAFDDVLLVGGSHLVVPLGEASLSGDVLEDDGAGLDGSSDGDGAVVGIEDRGEDSCGAGASLGRGLGSFLRLVLLCFQRRLGEDGCGTQDEQGGEHEEEACG